MADNVAVTAGSGTSIAADDIGSVFHQRVKISVGADGSAADCSTTNPLPTAMNFVTCSTDVTRPADGNQYAVNDCISDSTSAPTTFTFTSAAHASAGSGIITDACFVTSADAGTLLQAELFLFNQSVTSANDNAAFAISDADAKFLIGIIPFTMQDIGNNGYCHVPNLAIGYTAVGSANLRFLLRAKNTYTPASGEVITCIIKCQQIT